MWVGRLSVTGGKPFDASDQEWRGLMSYKGRRNLRPRFISKFQRFLVESLQRYFFALWSGSSLQDLVTVEIWPQRERRRKHCSSHYTSLDSDTHFLCRRSWCVFFSHSRTARLGTWSGMCVTQSRRFKKSV